MEHTDIIIIGSGIAAMSTAIEAAVHKNVIIITKSRQDESNSFLAQGGIAAVTAPGDTVEKHAKDTIAAGCGYNNLPQVYDLVESGPAAIERLIESGLQFDRNESGQLSLGLEGAHSERRILHCCGDSTGRKIMEHMLTRAEDETRITIIENETAVELLVNRAGECIGTVCKTEEGSVKTYYAQHVVLATGGMGALFQFTSNAPSATGTGLAMALKAGAELVDMEFIQFHPTLLYVDGKTRGLISEAVRGEGAVLVTAAGTPIMEGIHPLGDLAPRHIVAQTIFSHLEAGTAVYLDISGIPDFGKKFPGIAAICRTAGAEPSLGKLPVAPGAHFLMGGIKTGPACMTSVPFLYAVGEAACTGVHGANRLASNSLLEGLVSGTRLGIHLAEAGSRKYDTAPVPRRTVNNALKLPEQRMLREMMMKHCGITRDQSGLGLLCSWLESFDLYEVLHGDLSGLGLEDSLDAMNLVTAWTAARAALARTESRGSHYREDFPEENTEWAKAALTWDTRRLQVFLEGREYVEQN
ncbi:L-aspartate oxidase [Peribacillus sp. SCS-26]|uniref:L-aspartate oxidase n=1 Tax=Paraperibacillus marinus TaxID=3115295 RepID=UPI0039062DA1